MDSQELVTLLQEFDLWPEEASVRAEIAQLQKTHADARTLGRELLQRNILTPYQANQLLTGNGRSLVFGPYRILDTIAKGGMGVVYRARHFRIHRVVALKVIHKERVTGSKSVERFLREVRAAARLSHPNVVRAYDADKVGDEYYFAMEFLDGEDLSRQVKKAGPLTLDRAGNYLLQAAAGLQHIHENDLIHRDIKPSNLMVITKGETNPVYPFGQLKLLDLGLAHLIEDPNAPPEAALTQFGAVLGTTDYMSPEQAIHSRNVDIRSDIYSLGCTGYYTLAGDVPFPGGGPVEKILKHQLDTPIPLEQHRPDIPRPLIFVIAKMMARKREARFQTPRELAEAIQTAIDSRPALAVPVQPG